MIYFSAWMRHADEQGTWNILINNDQVRNGYLRNDTHNDGDEISFKAFMPAGTYTCKIVTVKSSGMGISKVKINGTTVLTTDNYSSSTIRNVIVTQADITIANAGIKNISWKVEGKNASSSDHYSYLSEMVLYRTN